MTTAERDGQTRSASARRPAPDGKNESYESGWAPSQDCLSGTTVRILGAWRAARERLPWVKRSVVGATKLEVELQLVAEPVRGARKQEAWELTRPLVRRPYIAAVIVPRSVSTCPTASDLSFIPC